MNYGFYAKVKKKREMNIKDEAKWKQMRMTWKFQTFGWQWQPAVRMNRDDDGNCELRRIFMVWTWHIWNACINVCGYANATIEWYTGRIWCHCKSLTSFIPINHSHATQTKWQAFRLKTYVVCFFHLSCHPGFCNYRHITHTIYRICFPFLCLFPSN